MNLHHTNLISDLRQRVIEFSERESLFTKQDILLLAVSGGLDSVVLCDLLNRAGYRSVIAHCNFRLRGDESDRDEAFVAALGRSMGLPVHVRHFDTSAEAAVRKCAIQEAARIIRYEWFGQLAAEIATQTGRRVRIVTAHHLDDNVETLLMNFLKGTGVSGMRGMLPYNGSVARPLLSVTKAELREYADAAGLKWVEDSSNAEDKYSRNFIRHHLLPVAESIYPQSFNNLAGNLERFRDIEILYNRTVKATLSKLMYRAGNAWQVPVEKLRLTPAVKTITWEIIREFGFSPGQVDEVLALLDSDTGRHVSSAEYRILKNRKWLLISRHEMQDDGVFLLDGIPGEISFQGGRLTAVEFPVPPADLEKTDPSLAWIDAREVIFPLILRKWRKGDYFYPLGMRKKKKIARFLIDTKCSMTQKERTWVLESGKRIVWVVGMRIDDRFRITQGTKAVIRLELSSDKGS